MNRLCILSAGEVTTIAGNAQSPANYIDGPAANARFRDINAITVNPITGDIYVADNGVNGVNCVIRVIDTTGHKSYNDCIHN